MAKQTIGGITADFQQGAWYGGRQAWQDPSGNWTLSLPGQVNKYSNQQGAGQMVSSEVNRQSDAAQGLAPGTIDDYLAKQRAILSKGADMYTAPGGAPADSVGSATFSGGSFGVPGGGSSGAINLQGIYDKAYQDSGVMKLVEQANSVQAQIDEIAKRRNEAESSINENPFLSEATRVGRIQKLNIDTQNEINALNGQKAGILEQINTAKTDVETKLNLATKQYDIDQNARQESMSQFNTLLAAGALDNAAPGDIAQFAAAMGLPVSFIQGAVQKNKAKNVESKLIQSTDDNGNVTVSLVNIRDGQLEVVGNQSLGRIDKSSSRDGAPSQSAVKMQAIGEITQVLDTWKNSYGHVSPSQWAEARSAWLATGLPVNDFNANFAAYTDPQRTDFNQSYGFDPKSRGANQYQIQSQGF